MKAMQDKEFDKTFADALGNMEEMPSEKAWAGISKRMVKPKRSYWNPSIAASLLLMLSAGLWMYTRKTVEPKDTTAQVKAAKRIQEARPEEWHQQALREEQKAEMPVLVKVSAERIIKQKRESAREPVLAKNRLVGKEEQEFKETFASQTSEPVLTNNNERVSLASAESLSSVQSNNEISEPEKIAVKRIALPADKLPAKKHSVKSIGDLVNLVVAKVDKRQEKIIQFTDSDGESNITGINLGFINIQKAK